MNEAGAGTVAPTLTAGSDWQFPTSQHFALPTTFSGIAQKSNYIEKPLLKALHTTQYLVQNIVSDPAIYGLNDPARQIIGNPRSGGTITGLNYNKMISAGASHGLKFLPTEFDNLEKIGIFSRNTTGVTIDLGKLYQIMKTEIGKDVGKDHIAAAADSAVNSLTTGMTTPGNGAMNLQRKAYGV